MGFFDKFKKKTEIKQEQASINKFPIILYENAAINARPPYKILQFEDGVFIQIIDLMCRKFNDISMMGRGKYSIALFKIKSNEVEWIKSNTEKLNNLANTLYENIPEDRFVKASIVLENNTLFDIAVRPLCNSIDEKSSQNEQKFKLSIMEDTLNDAQKEKFVYTPIKNGFNLNRDYVKELSLREIMSTIFVLANIDTSSLSDEAKKIKDDNCGFLLSMAADWLKNNSFYVVCTKNNNMPIILSNNGMTFTCVYSSKDYAETAINGDVNLLCREISLQKPEFWQSLMQNGISQIVADNSPMTLTVQGCYMYSIATVQE